MTKDDIILMADASGIAYYGMGKDREKFLHYLEAFADLVAAAKPWQGLTDEDWAKIEDMPDAFDQGVAWAQARLKEKNT